MNKKVCFIGHRNVFKYNQIRENLYSVVEQEIKKGCKFFTMGTRGEFDKLALSICRELRNIYKDIEIEVVITSFKEIKPIIDHDPIFGDEKYIPYSDVKTTMYDIEEEHYKRKIVVSNQQMIDNCDTLICYVNPTKTYGGAKYAYQYAKKQNKKIINFYDEKDDLTYGMPKEQKYNITKTCEKK